MACWWFCYLPVVQHKSMLIIGPVSPGHVLARKWHVQLNALKQIQQTPKWEKFAVWTVTRPYAGPNANVSVYLQRFYNFINQNSFPHLMGYTSNYTTQNDSLGDYRYQAELRCTRSSMLGPPVHWWRWHCLLLSWQKQWTFQLSIWSQPTNQCPFYWPSASRQNQGLYLDSSPWHPLRLAQFLSWGHRSINLEWWGWPSKILPQWGRSNHTGRPVIYMAIPR